MVWRSRTTPQDRFFACLVYVLPLIEAYLLAQPIILFLEQLVPIAGLLLLPLRLFADFYLSITGLFSIGSFGLGGFLIFMVLIAAVVRNDSICHFVRFNTMQSIIIGIALSLFTILWQLFTSIIPINLSLLTLLVVSSLFLGTAAICIYSIVQSAMGKYAEIPTISRAVERQVP
ncbi:MAG: Tic20 family protein [Leptolyngbyaceae bacterium]|nr:Tic20 family protein [Leptolyngbyaceae bacterium]